MYAATVVNGELYGNQGQNDTDEWFTMPLVVLDNYKRVI